MFIFTAQNTHKGKEMKHENTIRNYLGGLLLGGLIVSCTKPATNNNSSSTTSTSLQMTIYDGSGMHRVISPSATVQLYTTVADQQNKTHPFTPLEASNSQGVLIFKNLQPIDYYFNAYSADGTKSNATTFNQTNTLTAGIVNKLEPVVK